MITIQDLTRICKLSLKRYDTRNRGSYNVEIKMVGNYKRIYFTNGLFACKYEFPRNYLNGVECGCVFSPSEFLASCEASDKCSVQYLRDIHKIDLLPKGCREWNPSFEKLQKTDCTRGGKFGTFTFNNNLVCDVLRLMRQLGFFEVSFYKDDKHPARIYAVDGSSSIECIVMPISK